MRILSVIGFAAGLVLVAAPVCAAPAKKPAAKSATAKKPAAKAAPVPEPVPVYETRAGIHIPQATIMKPLTPVEAEANAIWNLRAGLNVAALQCQYSPFLATVRIYNDLLKHHSAELTVAQTTMIKHFKRYDGVKALNSFDQYTTRTYNSFSTLDAQYAFCLASSEVGRGALMLAKGDLGKYALAATPVLRTSLTPVPNSVSLWLVDVEPDVLPAIDG